MSLHFECKKKYGDLGDLYFKLTQVLFMSGFCQFTAKLDGNTLYDVFKITQNKLNEANDLFESLNIQENQLFNEVKSLVIQKLTLLYD